MCKGFEVHIDSVEEVEHTCSRAPYGRTVRALSDKDAILVPHPSYRRRH